MIEKYYKPVVFVLLFILLIMSVLVFRLSNQISSLQQVKSDDVSRLSQMQEKMSVLEDELKTRRQQDFPEQAVAELQTNQSSWPVHSPPGVSIEKEPVKDILSVEKLDDAVVDNRIDDVANPNTEAEQYAKAKQALAALRYDDAIDSFSKVQEEEAAYIRARMGIAQSYFYAHKYERAAEEFSAILDRQPAQVEAAVGLANAYQRLGEHDKQVAALDRAIETEPDNWLHYNNRATAWLAGGEYEKAMTDYQQAEKHAGQNQTFRANALENIGIIHLSQERWQTALDHADEVNQIDATLGWNWLFRGIAAARLERNIDAYVSYDNWFKYRKASDNYLLKQLLPESLFEYVDVSAQGLPLLVDPPLQAGEPCVNDYQCDSRSCRPGAPDNRQNYCVLTGRDCAAPDSIGFLEGEFVKLEGISVRCYLPVDARPRWTRDSG